MAKSQKHRAKEIRAAQVELENKNSHLNPTDRLKKLPKEGAAKQRTKLMKLVTK